MSNLSQWSKNVKKALIDRGWTMRVLAEKIGYSTATVSAVVTGRYPNATGDAIVEKINTILGTKGGPERIVTDEWRDSVRVEMVKRHISVYDLAKEAGVTRDKMSQIINGRQWDEEIIAKIVEILEIEAPVVPSAS